MLASGFWGGRTQSLPLAELGSGRSLKGRAERTLAVHAFGQSIVLCFGVEVRLGEASAISFAGWLPVGPHDRVGRQTGSHAGKLFAKVSTAPCTALDSLTAPADGPKWNRRVRFIAERLGVALGARG